MITAPGSLLAADVEERQLVEVVFDSPRLASALLYRTGNYFDVLEMNRMLSNPNWIGKGMRWVGNRPQPGFPLYMVASQHITDFENGRCVDPAKVGLITVGLQLVLIDPVGRGTLAHRAAVSKIVVGRIAIAEARGVTPRGPIERGVI